MATAAKRASWPFFVYIEKIMLDFVNDLVVCFLLVVNVLQT